ncbi:MAG: PKD domain protein, partial [Leeuwenhoekiella sp.]|nr:PKD domain protein [Leeuwenhoekiella sp.]
MKILRLLIAFLAVAQVFTACEDDVVTNYALQEISAPTGVAANFAITQDDTGMVTITPVGEGASTFTIDFGVEGEAPQTINAGESVTYTYTEGEYLVRITATGATGLTSEFNQMINVSFTAPENLDFETTVSGLTAVVTPTADNA